eukprot:2202194-Pyramimonas_sp.AAC.3
MPLRSTGYGAKALFGTAKRSFANPSRPVSLRRSLTTRVEAAERVEKSDSEWKKEVGATFNARAVCLGPAQGLHNLPSLVFSVLIVVTR